MQGAKSISQTTSRPSARRKGISLARLSAYLIIGLGAIFCLTPFYIMLVYGSHSVAEIFSFPPPLWFGDQFFTNVENLLAVAPFWRNLWNSFYIAIMATAFTLFFCSLAGFAFAMYDFKGRETMFTVVLATLLIPGFLNLVPFYLMMQAIGWIDRPIALYLPGAASAFGIFLMRQFIGATVPRDLLEAARIDGASEFGLFWRIIIPLARPALGTLGLVTFIGAWNNYQGALVVMQSKETFTAQLALGALKGAFRTDWGALFAGTVITVVPLLIIFAFTSKQLIEGLTAGSVKG